MTSVLPMIIGNGSRSSVMLHLWHANPSPLLRGFLDIHSTDPENLNKILNICLELKIISPVLDMTPSSFSIRLAVLASGKEQLNLEKWLNDNLSPDKDTFFEECLKFLKETPLGASQDVPTSPFQHSGAIGNVSSEIGSTFFKALRSQAGQNISPDLFEEMKRLLACTQSNPSLQNGGASDSSTADGYPEDVEAEANSYFHQMFSGQLTIDAMVQMLARFKEPSEKREQSIFGCMIGNLFEEYKFFPKYPERQLKIAAVLFGSLVKHQLVTHLTLGIAFHGVLDALRKSSNSKAYEKGLMIAVILFTSKVLEPCQSSLAYQPPNPWTMAILGLLAESYALPNLKMNLKFDIEVLFKNLCVDMKDVKPTPLIKDRAREVEGNPDFSNKDLGASQPQNVAEVNPVAISSLSQVEIQPEVANQSHPGGHSHLLSQYTAPLHLASGLLVDDDKMASLSLSDRLPSGQGMSQLPPPQSSFSKLSQLGLTIHFQSVLPGAMERAIKEIMTPVIQRSVTIAMQSTRELVLKDFAMESDESWVYNAAHLMVASLAGSLAHVTCKDFAMESDESWFYNAAHLMVASLAGSLAHVTCKEPLRVSISNHLRNLLQSLNVANDLLEHAVQLVTNDNLDLGCAAVEHAASDKAE